MHIRNVVITYKEMMHQIRHGVDDSGQPIPFSFTGIEADTRRKTAGKPISESVCIYKPAKRKNLTRIHQGKLADLNGTGYEPSLGSGTITVHVMPADKPIRISPRLNIEFNGKEVHY
jgi:hypothetical protein